jgi:hypothetical protein
MELVKTASGKKSIKISKKEWKSIGKTAGWMKISNSNVDLFEHQELVPSHIQGIISKYDEQAEESGPNLYLLCQHLIEELEQNGYTADYGLDGIPFGLKKL